MRGETVKVAIYFRSECSPTTAVCTRPVANFRRIDQRCRLVLLFSDNMKSPKRTAPPCSIHISPPFITQQRHISAPKEHKTTAFQKNEGSVSCARSTFQN